MKYEIDENNAVWGYVEGEDVACLYQPHWPNGEAFADKADATVFADAWILHMSNPQITSFPVAKPVDLDTPAEPDTTAE